MCNYVVCSCSLVVITAVIRCIVGPLAVVLLIRLVVIFVVIREVGPIL